MSRVTALLLGFLMLAMPLTGCIDSSDVSQQSAGPLGDVADDATAATDRATSAVVHTPDGVALNASLSAALGVDVPHPVGIARQAPAESFEPTIGVTSNGDLFLSTFDPAYPGWGLLTKTEDQGQTWSDVTPKIVENATFPPQSNDPYVHVDERTDRIFLSDLQALVCSTLSWSDDGGETWTNNPIGCGQPFGVHDHQTVFTSAPRTLDTTGYPSLVHYCINRVADAACATSVDGGQTFGPLRPLVYAGVDATEADDGAFCGGLHAHGVSDPDGRIFLGKGHCGTPHVAISEDDGLTWHEVEISQDVPAAKHDVELATDAESNVYAMWISDDDKPYLAVSTDHGFTWSDPIDVAPPGVQKAVFPAVAGGADGRAALTFVGTTDTADWDEMDGDTTWNGYVSLVLDATADEPVLSTSPVNPPSDPLARGACDDDNRCDGMGDFNDIVIDGDGRPWAAYVDVCNAECVDGSENDVPVGTVGTLVDGPALRGSLGALPTLDGVDLPNGTE